MNDSFEGRRAGRQAVAIALLCLFGREAFAITAREAGENLLYFEHARLGSEVCEREGTPVRAAYEAWLARNNVLLRTSVETLRSAVAAPEGGLSASEQADVVAQAVQSITTSAQEHITSHGVQCQRFPELLKMYSDLLKR